MILIYRFTDANDVKLATPVLENNPETYWLHFERGNDALFVSSRIDPKKGVSIGFRKETPLKSLDCINSLTLSQRHCLLFLITSVLSKQAYVIQGSTASGKTHLVRLFAGLLGKKLVTIQLNGDIGIPSLTDQFLPQAELSKGDIEGIRAVLTAFPEADDLNRTISELISLDNPSSWSPPALKNVLSVIARYGARTSDPDEQSKAAHALTVIRTKMSFLHHLQHKDSAFINAMKTGQ
jgi:hypothetical protein